MWPFFEASILNFPSTKILSISNPELVQGNFRIVYRYRFQVVKIYPDIYIPWLWK